MTEIRNPQELESKNFSFDSLQESVLAYGIAREDDSVVIGYWMDKGKRKLKHLDEMNTGMLVEKFAQDPKTAIAYARNNILEIMKDRRMTKEERIARVKRYVDAFLNLQIKLDRMAYPPSDKVGYGIPEYLPDGLSDMGSDPNPIAEERSREKIRVDKEDVFRQSKDLLYDIFSTDFGDIGTERIKTYITKKIAQFVYEKMPYSYDDPRPFRVTDRSIAAGEPAAKKAAVCRHHAIYTQILLQACGITSRLLKNDVDFGDGNGFNPHGANIVRIQGKWFLLDSTNPDIEGGKLAPFLVQIEQPGTKIDLNKKNYTWQAKRKDGRTYSYRSRNNMYWKIGDNINDKIRY